MSQLTVKRLELSDEIPEIVVQRYKNGVIDIDGYWRAVSYLSFDNWKCLVGLIYIMTKYGNRSYLGFLLEYEVIV